MRHSVGKSCPALSSELGLMLLTAQVVRGSVGSPNVMVGDRLELDACDLELVCTLYLVPSTFEVSAYRRPRLRRIVQERNFASERGFGLQAAVFLPSSLWLEERRHGGHRHGSQKIAWIILYPTINKWVTPFLHPKQQIKFQVSPASGCAGSFRKELWHQQMSNDRRSPSKFACSIFWGSTFIGCLLQKPSKARDRLPDSQSAKDRPDRGLI